MLYDHVEVVINQLVRTFNLQDWQYDVEPLVEDIAEALKLIGAAKVYTDVVVDLQVSSYLIKLPAGLQHIKGLIPSGTPYRERGPFLEVYMPDGATVTLEYQGMPLDTRGYVLVPDSPEVRAAVMWYLVKILILQGHITKINYQFADSEWNWRCGSARASLNAFSVQDAYKLYTNFVKLNPAKDQHLNNYEGMHSGNTLNREKNRYFPE